MNSGRIRYTLFIQVNSSRSPFYIHCRYRHEKIYNLSHEIFFFDKFNNFKKITKVFSSLLIISVMKDEVIPHSHSVNLFSKANHSKECLFIGEAMHNNLYDFDIDKKVIKFNS